ncbi:MAG: TylF/MycF/NovP-related O-methyltransferase [Pseudonocardiaceae bacterium]
MNMYHLVSQVIAYGVDGDVVELGCNEGQSAVLIQRVINNLGSTKVLHLYDSFEGLPSTAAGDDSSYQERDLATTEDAVRASFHRYGLPQPVVHRGWFSETLPAGLPASISFAHPDGWNHLRGVQKACDEFLHDTPERVSSIYSGCLSHGFFRKL